MRGRPDIPDWESTLARYPTAILGELDAARRQGGVLTAGQVRWIGAVLNRDVPAIMTRLLPLAACYAVVPVSGFRVGAIAAGPGRWPALYFGANLEIAGGALGFSVHAEQAAINNAWLHGVRRLSWLAVTAAPCGHCRQFINELVGGRSLGIVIVGKKRTRTLEELLPSAFGPANLGIAERLLQPATKRRLRIASHDALARRALAEAVRSHAPYSGSPAGCALEMADGAVVSGRSAENAAYNPTLPAVLSALSAAVFDGGPVRLRDVRRTALVEFAGTASQAAMTEAVIGACAPAASFEYHRATR